MGAIFFCKVAIFNALGIIEGSCLKFSLLSHETKAARMQVFLTKVLNIKECDIKECANFG